MTDIDNAAERVRRIEACESVQSVYGTTSFEHGMQEYGHDRTAVIEAYLAQQPSYAEQAAELEAAWKMIESEFDIEPRAQIEAEAKTNGFKYGLAQAVHTIWKRDAKVTELAAELAELRAENRRLSDSLPWCNDKTRADAAERLGEVYRHRMSLSEPYPEIGVVEAQNAQQVVIVLLAQVNACVDELAELRAKLEAAEKEAALRSDMIDSDCMAAINTLRMNEGNSVTLICDNPDFGGPNNAIECSGDWTNWQTKRFTGDRLLTSLQSALKEYFAWHGEECEPPKKLTDLRTAAATFDDSRPVDEALLLSIPGAQKHVLGISIPLPSSSPEVTRFLDCTDVRNITECPWEVASYFDGGSERAMIAEQIPTISQLNHLLAALRPGGVK